MNCGKFSQIKVLESHRPLRSRPRRRPVQGPKGQADERERDAERNQASKKAEKSSSVSRIAVAEALTNTTGRLRFVLKTFLMSF